MLFAAFWLDTWFFETSYDEVGSQGLFLLLVLLLAKYNCKQKMPDVTLNCKSLFFIQIRVFLGCPINAWLRQVFLMPNGKQVSSKKLRRYLKSLCKQCGFENPKQYKLHTFRHFFASYCAQQNMSYKYVLEWMGHSSSAILDMYFTMNDRHSQNAMNSLSFSSSENAENRTVLGQSGPHFSQTLSQRTHSKVLTEAL